MQLDFMVFYSYKTKKQLLNIYFLKIITISVKKYNCNILTA